ncbi:hypothetical protein CBM2634_B20135 [Cupriavidus taiwanensis]|uniref:Uncharacterized protein n=1 Tax=Cupriavidus taiwanensis TaxID=164546 RepID=A0A375J961_9BURK|nr:hypothetical protein CBM2634_B20135 [Cupriavidus taiwanensis]
MGFCGLSLKPGATAMPDFAIAMPSGHWHGHCKYACHHNDNTGDRQWGSQGSPMRRWSASSPIRSRRAISAA